MPEHAPPKIGSYAIDHGGNVTNVPSTDQRGLARPVGATFEIGAVETGNLNSLIVTSAGDDNDGDYSYGDFSLREAIGLAAVLPGSSTITFAPNVVAAGRIELNSLLTVGSLSAAMHDTLTIQGPGADLLAIDANNVANNVFYFTTNSGSYNAVIRGLTLTGASGVAVNSNAANDILTLDQLEITGSGGEVSYFYGTITISNSTIAQNHGLGVSVAYVTAKIWNSTISDNHTTGPVAGISAAWGTLSLINDTVVNNRADENNTSGMSSGVGGVLASTYSSVTVNNTIVAGNLAGKDGYNPVVSDVGGTMSGSYNLIGYAAQGVWTSGSNNHIGTSQSSPYDAALAALGYYGGHTRTRPPKVTSYAIDHGGNVTNVPTTDQRGFARPVGTTFDIGAIELALGEIYT